MALTFEQFKELRTKGLSNEQIAKFESDFKQKKITEPKKSFLTSYFTEPKKTLGKIAEFGEKTFGRASGLFKTFGKTAGTLVGSFGEQTEKFTRPKELEQKIDPALAQKLKEQGLSDEAIRQKLLVKPERAFKPEEITKADIAFTALEIYPGGGFVSQLLKKIKGGEILATGFNNLLNKIPANLRESAVKQYSEALGATTLKLKSKTAKVVPELLERKEKIISLGKISQKAKDIMGTVGESIKAIERKLPQEKMTAVKPLISGLKKMINRHIVDGKIVNSNAVSATIDTMKIITQFGDKISTRSLIKVRRLLDDSIALANKDFTKSEGLTMTMKAKEKLANTIRKELAKDLPDLAKVNREFSLWSNVSKVVDATIARRATQTGGLTRQIATIAGAVAGIPGGVGKVILGGLAGRGVVKLLQSSAYKTISAINKKRLADLIASGDIKKASFFASKLLAGLKNIID